MRDNADIEMAFNMHGDAVLAACLTYLGSKHRAEDAFQDAFLKYAMNETCFNDEEHRKAWLLRVAINVCKDMLRKASAKDVELDESHDAPAHEDEGEQFAERDRLVRALQTLPDDQRQALVLTAVAGYTAVQAAEIMGMPVNTVYSHITRGKRAMRKALSDE